MCQAPRCQRFVGMTKGHIAPLSAFFPLTFSSIPLSPKIPLFWFFPPDRATAGLHPEIWWLTDVRYQRITWSSWRTGRGRTYSVGDLYFVDFLKRRSVKERQRPVSLVFLHRRPRYDQPIVWAKTAVGPYRDRQTSAVQNPNQSCQEPRPAFKLHVLHCKVVGQPRGHVDGSPEVPYVPHFQRVVT